VFIEYVQIIYVELVKSIANLILKYIAK